MRASHIAIVACKRRFESHSCQRFVYVEVSPVFIATASFLNETCFTGMMGSACLVHDLVSGCDGGDRWSECWWCSFRSLWGGGLFRFPQNFVVVTVGVPRVAFAYVWDVCICAASSSIFFGIKLSDFWNLRIDALFVYPRFHVWYFFSSHLWLFLLWSLLCGFLHKWLFTWFYAHLYLFFLFRGCFHLWNEKCDSGICDGLRTSL